MHGKVNLAESTLAKDFPNAVAVDSRGKKVMDGGFKREKALDFSNEVFSSDTRGVLRVWLLLFLLRGFFVVEGFLKRMEGFRGLEFLLRIRGVISLFNGACTLLQLGIRALSRFKWCIVRCRFILKVFAECWR